jgi:hypothetical protein
MRIAKILPSPDKNDKMQILIHNGTNEILLKANSIKEMVDWTNALLLTQKQCLEGRYNQFKPKQIPGTGKNSPNKSDHSRGSLADPFSNDRYSVAGGASNADFNATGTIAPGGSVNWSERLNMRFFSKVFS